MSLEVHFINKKVHCFLLKNEVIMIGTQLSDYYVITLFTLYQIMSFEPIYFEKMKK